VTLNGSLRRAVGEQIDRACNPIEIKFKFIILNTIQLIYGRDDFNKYARNHAACIVVPCEVVPCD
jgi:hypothetical protein